GARDDRGGRLGDQPLLLLPYRAWRGRAPAFRRPDLRQPDRVQLPRGKTDAETEGDAGLRGQADRGAGQDPGKRPAGSARYRLFRSRHLGHRRNRRLLQHVEPHGRRNRHAAERAIPFDGAIRSIAWRWRDVLPGRDGVMSYRVAMAPAAPAIVAADRRLAIRMARSLRRMRRACAAAAIHERSTAISTRTMATVSSI